ncbi:MAG: ribonuclease R [Oscillospiraceae bacterium]
MKNMQKELLSAISKSTTPIVPRSLLRDLQISRKDMPKFYHIIDELVKAKTIIRTEKGLVIARTVKPKKSIPAVVIRIHDKFGFVRLEDSGEEIFVPGRHLLGAMPGDRVMVATSAGRGNLSEGVITDITEHIPYQFSGTIFKQNNKCQVVADRDFKLPINIRRADISFVKDGEKVVAEIEKYGSSHFDHIARIVKTFGSAQSAKNCCEAILESNSIHREFPEDVIEQAKSISEKGIHIKEIEARTDLREELIFTIDSADSKDLDDAISLKKLPNGWKLGVHIADVSYYVYQNCPLDKEAFERGTSVYFADSVVPMLPKEISNGICSLNANEDRLAFSASITLDEDCNIKDYYFEKTVIRSVVKGVYSEVNSIIAKEETEEIRNKYEKVLGLIFDMNELAQKLTAKRLARGAVNLESIESKIVLNEDGFAVDILPRERGISECIIEEFMLIANEAAALFANKQEIPFVFRIHEDPTAEKLSNLKELLNLLGINTSKIVGGAPCSVMSEVLDKVKGTRYQKLVNNAILRSMSKAKYNENSIGHYGLVLKNYTHFTSPIRRYSDLTIHRVMSALLTGMKRENIEKRYRQFVPLAAKQASFTEQRSMNVERDCEDAYKAEYILAHIGEEYDGIVSAVAPHGIYIELDNTVEGMCKPEQIEKSNYVFDGKIQFKDVLSGNVIRVGDSVRIKVTGADVSAGNIDFDIIKFNK